MAAEPFVAPDTDAIGQFPVDLSVTKAALSQFSGEQRLMTSMHLRDLVDAMDEASSVIPFVFSRGGTMRIVAEGRYLDSELWLPALRRLLDKVPDRDRRKGWLSLRGCTFAPRADLSGMNFYWVDLSGVSMVDADLSDAHIVRANLNGADLS